MNSVIDEIYWWILEYCLSEILVSLYRNVLVNLLYVIGLEGRKFEFV